MNHHCRIKSVRLKCLPGFVYTGDFERGNVQAHALMSSGRSATALERRLDRAYYDYLGTDQHELLRRANERQSHLAYGNLMIQRFANQ